MNIREYTAYKSFSLAIAHRLQNHEGKCKNIHGHNYKVEIAFQRKAEHTLNDDGMVIDFGTIKQHVVSAFMYCYDHALFLERTDPYNTKLYAPVHDVINIVDMDVPPTAENMACMFLNFANRQLAAWGYDNVVATSVTIWETETSRVTATS